MSYFTAQFRTLCQLRRVAVSAVAAECGVNQSNLSRILHGERQMTLESLERIVNECTVFTENDKLALIRSWLTDQTPEQFRDRIVVHGQPNSLREEDIDELQAALRYLQKSTIDPKFAEWLIQLHKMLTRNLRKK